ncbi:MAG: DsbA family protein, partial [Solirubrobacteraceae bacterium]|nr:DsbA family protein [Solirubrobacteraceae bacterium]
MSQPGAEPQVALYYDLGSPYGYLAAERIEALLGREVEFRPVLLGAIFGKRGHGSWSLTPLRDDGIAEVERRAARYGLPPVRWPEPWPGNGLFVMRAAIVADQMRRGKAFALAAYRAAFVEGRDLSQLREIDRIATDVGLDAVRVVEELSNPRVKQKLVDATTAAWEAGVRGVPTVLVGDVPYFGDDQLDLVARDLAGLTAAP